MEGIICALSDSICTAESPSFQLSVLEMGHHTGSPFFSLFIVSLSDVSSGFHLFF